MPTYAKRAPFPVPTSFDVPLEYVPLLQAGIALGEWLGRHPNATAQQRRDVERTLAWLRAVPAVPTDVEEAEYWVILEHVDRQGNLTGERWAWNVHIGTSGLGVGSYFSDMGARARGEEDIIADASREVWWDMTCEHPETPTERGRKHLIRQLQRIGESTRAPGARVELHADVRMHQPPKARKRK